MGVAQLRSLWGWSSRRSSSSKGIAGGRRAVVGRRRRGWERRSLGVETAENWWAGSWAGARFRGSGRVGRPRGRYDTSGMSAVAKGVGSVSAWAAVAVVSRGSLSGSGLEVDQGNIWHVSQSHPLLVHALQEVLRQKRST